MGPTSATADGLDPVGVLLALSAAASQAVFVLISRQGYRQVPTEQAMGFILFAAAAIAAVLALVVDGAASLAQPLTTPNLLGLLVFGGVFAAAVPSTLFLAGIRWIGPVRAGILMLLEPLVGVLLAALFLQEAIGPIQALGGLAILGAAVLIQRAQPGRGGPHARRGTGAAGSRDGAGTRCRRGNAARVRRGPGAVVTLIAPALPEGP